MKANDILTLIKTVELSENLENVEKNLSKNYEVSLGKYDSFEIKRAIDDLCPVILIDCIIIGYDLDTKTFVDQNENHFKIERPVDAIIVTDCLEPKEEEIEKDELEQFAIMGTTVWGPCENDLFIKHIQPLTIGLTFIPSHSAVFNFLNPTEQTKKEGIVSKLSGININIYDKDRYFENILHEIGHLFYRTRLTPDEKDNFKKHFKTMKPSALVEFDWEIKDSEEYFCTIYKWYLRSIFEHKSFLNIIEHEDPISLKFLQDVISNITNQESIKDSFELSKDDIDSYFNPIYDATSKRFIRKQGIFDRIKNLEIPTDVLLDIDSVKDGVKYINLTKSTKIVLNGNKIDFDKSNNLKDMQKANRLTKGKPVVYLDMDDCVADFCFGYTAISGRNAHKDDAFTVSQQVLTEPHFFRNLLVIKKGQELYDMLKGDYCIIFLTTPMEGMAYCKQDKILWAEEHFPDVKTILFSDNKSEYAASEESILIDDMDYNIDPFNKAGGTGIEFALDNKKIVKQIQSIFDKTDPDKVEKQLNKMDVEENPTDKQKKSGNYKKGTVRFKGMILKIENPVGSYRIGFNQEGLKWINKLKNTYGYIANGPDGNDGDKIDFFLGTHFHNNKAYVVNQGINGVFDEHKILLGFKNILEARQAYLSNYESGWEKNIISIIPTNTKRLREWLQNGNKTEEF